MAYDGNGNGNGKKVWSFGDALNWAFNILTALGTCYALLNQPNQARDIAKLETRINDGEKIVESQFENRGHIDDGALREMEVLDSQAKINMTNIARHESLLVSIGGNLDREIRDRATGDQECRKDFDGLRNDVQRVSAERLRIVDEFMDRISKDEQKLDALADSVQKVRTWR